MSLNGSGAGAGMFPMICCAKLAGIFENSQNTLRSLMVEKSLEKKRTTLTSRMTFESIWVAVAQIELKLGWVAGKYIE